MKATAWRSALVRMPAVPSGHWAVGGTAALALHGFPVVPGDLDLLADADAAARLISGLGDAVVADEEGWDRGDVRASRRAAAVVDAIRVEILVDVETVSNGVVILGSPRLDLVDSIVVQSRRFPMLPLTAMIEILESMGKHGLAEMVRDSGV
jgi:hypothetical protein